MTATKGITRAASATASPWSRTGARSASTGSSNASGDTMTTSPHRSAMRGGVKKTARCRLRRPLQAEMHGAGRERLTDGGAGRLDVVGHTTTLAQGRTAPLRCSRARTVLTRDKARESRAMFWPAPEPSARLAAHRRIEPEHADLRVSLHRMRPSLPDPGLARRPWRSALPPMRRRARRTPAVRLRRGRDGRAAPAGSVRVRRLRVPLVVTSEAAPGGVT